MKREISWIKENSIKARNPWTKIPSYFKISIQTASRYNIKYLRNIWDNRVSEQWIRVTTKHAYKDYLTCTNIDYFRKN